MLVNAAVSRNCECTISEMGDSREDWEGRHMNGQ